MLPKPEHTRDQCVLLLTQSDAVLVQRLNEYRFHQADCLELLLLGGFHPCLVKVCNFIKEPVAVDAQLIDHFFNDRLGLQECVDAATYLLIQDFKHNS